MAEFRQMPQALLADRFHLTLYFETRDAPVYSLVRDKNGPKFHESELDANSILRMNGGGKITSSGVTMAQLAESVSELHAVIEAANQAFENESDPVKRQAIERRIGELRADLEFS